MYSEQDKYCQECICESYDLRGTNGCNKCDNTSHVRHCWWHPDECIHEEV